MEKSKKREVEARSSEGKATLDQSFPLESLLHNSTKLFEEALQQAFDDKRDFLVHELSHRLNSKINLGPVEVVKSSGWVEIESLSRLRSVVGGRFHNLKEKWLAAGFPLKEHRGDKQSSGELSQEGWLELATWISKQGFESRLAAQGSAHLFELRAIATDNK